MTNETKTINTQENFYSSHIFVFPFKWKYKGDGSVLLEDQTDISTIDDVLKKDSAYWETGKNWSKGETLLQYNEKNYFYDFVGEAIYDDDSEGSFLKHYRFLLNKPSHYCIEIKDQTGFCTYRLEIDEILLHIYNTGVGIMSFHLFNKEQSQSAPIDILRINQFGRRLFPPFYGTKTENIGTQQFFDDSNWVEGLDRSKGELANKIWLETNEKPFVIEDFSLKSVPPESGQLPNLILHLLPANLESKIEITPVLDDRMFVVCWYGNNDLAVELGKPQNYAAPPKEFEYHYHNSDWWYKFVFVDEGFKTCQNKKMTCELLEKHTNARWVGEGTLYGVSRYSFVSITGTLNQGFACRMIASHIQTMYFKMVELCLVQRACVLRFSDEVANISSLKDDKKLSKKVSSLYKLYIRFVNRIYFREVTAQEQGIELYEKIQECMQIEHNVKDLNNEINELHSYVMMQEETRSNDQIKLITILGALFVIPAFLTGFFGMSIADAVTTKWWFLLSVAIISVLSVFMVLCKKKWRWIWGILLVLLIALTIGLTTFKI